MTIVFILLITLGVFLLGVVVITIPGLLRLPREGKNTVDGVTTLDNAVQRCRASGLTGWDLVAYTQQLTARKFTYSRRNPWDTPARAFERGMGYCQQQASALKLLYDRLGIPARLVYTTRAKFPPKVVHGVREGGIVSGHTWVRVTIGGEERDVCPGNRENTPGKVHFTVLAEVRPMSRFFAPIAHLASVITNVSRDWKATGFKG